MLLPIGTDQSTVRRMPWVSLGIIGLCVVVYIATLIAPGDPRAIVDAEVRAVEYFLDHPWLELDPRLKGYVYTSLRQSRDSSPAPPSDSTRIAREQAELDSLVAGYFEARDRLPFWRWGLVPTEIHATSLISYTFIHAGLLHLIGNLLFFYLVGPAVEDAWGRPLFGVFYLLAGVVAALVFIARYPDLAEPLIGASGAVAGVMGAFAVRFRSSRITFVYFVWMVRIYHGTFSAPAGLMLGLWALGELAFAMGLWAFFSIADLGDIGFIAHVGGFVFGVVVALVVARLGLEERFVEPAVERAETVHDAGEVERLVELARRGRHEEAMGGLEKLLGRRPGDAEAAAALWNAAVAAGTPARALSSVVPAVTAAVRAGETGLLAQIWAELIRTTPDAGIDLRTATRAAELLMGDGLEGDVEATLGWLAGRVDASTPGGLLVRLARLAQRISLPAPFAALALADPDLDPALAAELTAE